MKNTIKLAAIGALMVAGLAQSRAQDSNTVFNVSQPINIALTGFAQASGATTVTAVHIGTKDVLSSLASALGTTFSPHAKLLILSASDGSFSSIIVRDIVSRSNVDTDVSGFFSMTTSVSVQKSNTSASGKTTGTQYSIVTFSFGSSDTNAPTTLSFTVQGYTTSSLSSGAFNSQVNGSGTDTSGDTAILKGNISAGANRKEKS